MSNIIKLTDREISSREMIQAEAVAWLVRLDSEETQASELEQFRQWADRSAYHREAFRQVTAGWIELDHLAGILDSLTDDRPAGTRTSVHSAGSFALNLRHVLAAALIATVSTLWFYPDRGMDRPVVSEIFTANYSTRIGQTRSISLPDTSGIRMNTDSEIEVHYSDDARIIRLNRGEAWFEVYHNPDRPFIVYAGKLAVRAVGTAFSVYVNEGKIDLTVTSGRIEVATLKEAAPAETPPDPGALATAVYRVPVVAGQNMVLMDSVEDRNETIERVQLMEPEQIEKELSWRDGILMFDNDTLEDVIVEINRYSPVKIVISDPSILQMRFGGYFQASDVHTILATLEHSYGIAVSHTGPDQIRLSRHPDSG